MSISKWKKHIFYMNDKEIVQYYGQQWKSNDKTRRFKLCKR